MCDFYCRASRHSLNRNDAQQETELGGLVDPPSSANLKQRFVVHFLDGSVWLSRQCVQECVPSARAPLFLFNSFTYGCRRGTRLLHKRIPRSGTCAAQLGGRHVLPSEVDPFVLQPQTRNRGNKRRVLVHRVQLS